jgi:N-acetylglucosaminyldiphosphoundecaprenol N-acetyl-beta-D-mannosaminyltransferase
VVVTVNTDHLVRLGRQPELKDVYERADLVLADGMPVVWAAARLGLRLPERVTGVDLMDDLCAELGAMGGSVFLLGSTAELVERAGREIVRRYPGLRLAGRRDGFFDPEDPSVAREVAGTGPDVVLVGMGSPRQERWVDRWRVMLPASALICVGGGLEVMAGVRRRAPRWMQRSGLEWLFRLVQEPGRLWHRYLVEDATFAAMVLREWRAQRRPVGVRGLGP